MLAVIGLLMGLVPPSAAIAVASVNAPSPIDQANDALAGNPSEPSAPSAESPAADAAPTFSPAEVQAAREAAHGTTAEAEAHLMTQRRGTRVNLVGQLEKRLGADFAGIWFDNGTGEFVVPVVTDELPAAVINQNRSAIRAEFQTASLDSRFRMQPVQSSKADLETAQATINEDLESYFEQGIIQTAIDPSSNTVEVRVPESITDGVLQKITSIVDNSAEGIAEVVRFPDSAFKMHTDACIQKSRTCDLPMRGGVIMYQTLSGDPNDLGPEACTAAFRANGLDGKKYILTAGHCTEEQKGNRIWNFMTTDTSGYRHTIGTVSQWHWPGKDWAKIDATGYWPDTPPWPTMLAFWQKNEPYMPANFEYPVVGESKSYKGQTLCHLGANSGTSCGEVVAENVYVEYVTHGEKLNSMFEVRGPNLCVAPGDSGGPFFASNIALGILSGGGPDGCPTTIFFSDIMAADADLGVNIAGPGAPEAITGSASNVQPYQATISGQANPHGASTSYRFEYGQGNVATWTPEGNLGSGQGFVPATATISGLLPNATYNYRIRAANAYNAAVGSEQTFTTPPVPPVVTTKPATFITSSAAILNATIDPKGAATSYFFEYGPSPSLGSKTEEISVGSGRTPVAVSNTATGLEFGANYYFRVVAKSIGGTSVGSTLTFTPGWKATTVALPTGLKAPVSNFNAIDCPAVNSCMAVGSASGASPELVQSFYDRWNGTSWTTAKIPQPFIGGEVSNFNGVSCVTASDCWAVGQADDVYANGYRAVFAHWNGTEWQTSVIAKPAGAKHVMANSISCPASNFCVATGSLETTASQKREVALRWDGTSWTYMTTPPIGSATYLTLGRVDCTSVSNCYASGVYFEGENQVVFASHWNGVGWSREILYTYSGGGLTRLYSIHCLSGTGLCVSGGAIMNEGKSVPLFAKTSGSGWTLSALPGVPLSTDKTSNFGGVACGSESLCEGVGSAESAAGVLLPIAARLRSDGVWERQTPPTLTETRATFSDLSCVSATYCMAVGTKNGYAESLPIAALYAK
jgi:hypothetical protein